MKDHPARPTFLDQPALRLLLFGGKGGVGKTTCAAATALRLAGELPEKNCLVVSTDPAHSLLDAFAGFPPPPNLEILELDTDAYLAAFIEKHRQKLKEIALRGTFLDEEDINRFLELSLPGMDELIAFLEISDWIERQTYDRIIVDTAPTGHTLRLLAMPEFIRKWLEALDVLLAKHRYMKKLFRGSYERDELDRFIEDLAASVRKMNVLLVDRQRCCFVPVMIAEKMSIDETLDLMAELKRLKIPARDVIVNRLFPENDCPVCTEGRIRQIRELANLFGSGRMADSLFWGIPLYPDETLGGAGLQGFWQEAGYLTSAKLIFRDRPAERQVAAVEAPPPPPPAGIGLIFLAGKGGVGKTTLAAATALGLATSPPGKEVLLFSADPAHSLSDCLNMEIGPDPRRVATGLWAMEVDAQAEFDKLKDQYREELKNFLGAALPNLDITFDREVMERLFSLSPPGLDEIMALTLVMEHMAAGKYELLIIDAAPTGHLLRLLELPEIVDSWLKVFFGLFLKYKNIFRLPKISRRLVKMSKELKKLRSMLQAPEAASLYAVSILTEMAFAETQDLIANCRRLGISVPVIFLNLATPKTGCPLCTRIEKRERGLREKYRQAFPAIHQAVIYRQGEPRGISRLTSLGRNLYAPAAAPPGSGKEFAPDNDDDAPARRAPTAASGRRPAGARRNMEVANRCLNTR